MTRKSKIMKLSDIKSGATGWSVYRAQELNPFSYRVRAVQFMGKPTTYRRSNDDGTNVSMTFLTRNGNGRIYNTSDGLCIGTSPIYSTYRAAVRAKDAIMNRLRQGLLKAGDEFGKRRKSSMRVLWEKTTNPFAYFDVQDQADRRQAFLERPSRVVVSPTADSPFFFTKQRLEELFPDSKPNLTDITSTPNDGFKRGEVIFLTDCRNPEQKSDLSLYMQHFANKRKEAKAGILGIADPVAMKKNPDLSLQADGVVLESLDQYMDKIKLNAEFKPHVRNEMKLFDSTSISELQASAKAARPETEQADEKYFIAHYEEVQDKIQDVIMTPDPSIDYPNNEDK